jgi:hypothetical protein
MVYLSIQSLLVWIERIQNLFEFSPLFCTFLLLWRCRRNHLFLFPTHTYLRCEPSPTAFNFIPGLLLQCLISFPSFSYYAFLHSAQSPTVLFVAFLMRLGVCSRSLSISLALHYPRPPPPHPTPPSF